MPKLKQRDEDVKNNLFRALVRKNMSLNGYTSLEQLAAVVGISRYTIYKKLKEPNTLTLGEVRKIFKVLRFSEEDRKIV